LVEHVPKNINNKGREHLESLIDSTARRVQQFARELLKGANHVTGLTKTAGGILDRAAVLLASSERGETSPSTKPVDSPLEAHQERMATKVASIAQTGFRKTSKPLRNNKTRGPAGANGKHDHVESQISLKLAAILDVAARLAAAEDVLTDAEITRGFRPLRIVSVADDQRHVILYITGSIAPQAALLANLSRLWAQAMFLPIRCVALAAQERRRGIQERQGASPEGSYSGTTEFGQAGRIIIRRQIEHILTRRYAAGYLGDLEYVHEMRVATRRMRAAIRVFEDVLELGRLKAQIANLADVLGQARDLDVFLDFLREYRDGCSGIRRAFAEEMISSWNVRRRASYRKVEAIMGSAAFGAFIGHAHKSFCLPVGADGGPKATSAGWKEPLWREARAILHRELRKMFRYAPDLKQYSPRKLHRLRIAGKRMRYLSEFFMPLYGRQIIEPIDYVKDVQAFLGDSHDSEVFIDQVREYVKSRSNGVADKSGPLIRSLQQRRRRSLSKATKVWGKLRGRSLGQKFMTLVDSPRRK
jgi:CHAD domain-containing protein